MATYKITSKLGGNCLNIYGENVTVLYNHQNVCLWADSGTNEQKWSISSLSSGVYVKSIINLLFGLNPYRVGSPWNCDVYPILGNETDASISFVQSGNFYKIRLTNYSTYYLTAGGNYDGASVYWATATNTDSQLWKVEEIPPEGTSKELFMTVNTNQKYSGNPQWIKDYGCAVCCEADVASYYDSNNNYTIQDIIDAGAGSPSVGAIWSNCPKASFTPYSAGNYLTKIRTELNSNHPVLIHCKNNAGNEHWVVAYKYTNSASSNANIHVLDPANTSSTQVGAYRTLAESMNYNYNLTYIEKLMLTSPKNS